VAGVLLLVGLIVLADTRELLRTVATIDARFLVLPVLLTLASYGAMARSYQGIALAAGVRFPLGEMLRITFVANSINYVVATGGLSGFAARLYFFTRRGVNAGTATIISLTQGFLTNLSLLFFVLLGFGYLLASRRLSGTALVAAGTLLAACVALALLSIALLALRTVRRRLIFVSAQLADRFLHRFFPRYRPARTRIWRFQRNLNRGIDFLLARKRYMLGPACWIVADWLFTMGILYAAFMAVHYRLPPGVLIIGFALGLALSFVSVIPAGLGLMEGSMAAVFTTSGVPFETSVVAVLLFRFAFHVIPLVTSAFFFRGLFAEGRAHSADADLLNGSFSGVLATGNPGDPRRSPSAQRCLQGIPGSEVRRCSTDSEP